MRMANHELHYTVQEAVAQLEETYRSELRQLAERIKKLEEFMADHIMLGVDDEKD